jgi:hypothetical protein
MPPPVRKSKYLGTLGYNDSPAELGEPSGFWHFESSKRLWQAFEISESLNQTFDTLGEPTYSRIVLATDEDGYILFHLLILSVLFISREREVQAIELAKAWLLEQGLDWRLPEAEWHVEDDGEESPTIELPF